MPLPPYQEQFRVGSRVRVKAPLLEEFQREWSTTIRFPPIKLMPLEGRLQSKTLASITEGTFFTNRHRFPVLGTKYV